LLFHKEIHPSPDIRDRAALETNFSEKYPDESVKEKTCLTAVVTGRIEELQ